MKKRGSATLVVILFSTIYMLYTASTYADIRHMKRKYEEYKIEITKIYDLEYQRMINEL